MACTFFVTTLSRARMTRRSSHGALARKYDIATGRDSPRAKVDPDVIIRGAIVALVLKGANEHFARVYKVNVLSRVQAWVRRTWRDCTRGRGGGAMNGSRAGRGSFKGRGNRVGRK
jgi:hypothetical protein